jgi:hypothetical protein
METSVPASLASNSGMFIFVGYKEIYRYVKTNGVGSYTGVIALLEGNR